MSNDFNDGYYGTGYRNSQQWAMGDQMRRVHEQQQAFYKQQQERLNRAASDPTPVYTGGYSSFSLKGFLIGCLLTIGAIAALIGILNLIIFLDGWS